MISIPETNSELIVLLFNFWDIKKVTLTWTLSVKQCPVLVATAPSSCSPPLLSASPSIPSMSENHPANMSHNQHFSDLLITHHLFQSQRLFSLRKREWCTCKEAIAASLSLSFCSCSPSSTALGSRTNLFTIHEANYN